MIGFFCIFQHICYSVLLNSYSKHAVFGQHLSNLSKNCILDRLLLKAPAPVQFFILVSSAIPRILK